MSGVTVWIVTSGAYSDYHIEGVFSTESEAARYLAEVRRFRDDADAEEWTVNECADLVYKPYYDATIALVDGQWLRGEHDSPPGTYGEIVPRSLRTSADFQAGALRFHVPCVTRRSYVSLEHAQGLCIEARQHWQRTGEVPG